jgi:hypothetical protein
MSWLIELLPLLLPLLKDCINKDGKQRIRENLKRPGPLMQFRVMRALKHNNVPDAKQKAIEICNALAAANDTDIDNLLEEAN